MSPYLDSLLSTVPGTATPLYSSFHFLHSAPTPPHDSPPNLLVVPDLLNSLGRTDALVTALDEAAVVAERLFWRVVGEGAREEGVEFFAREERVEDDE